MSFPSRSTLRFFLTFFLAVIVHQARAQVTPPTPRPRLIVTIVVDQLRADYLDRFSDLFVPAGRSGRDAGGFLYLRERGANFPRARYGHFPLFTGPGHAVVLTGGYPYKTGIVGNDWYSKAALAPVYSVQDPTVQPVGAIPGTKTKPMSPANLHSTTVGDELKMATGGAAKVVSLSLKDRAAILLGGHLSDATIWFDDNAGRFISSTFYCKNGQLPAWVEKFNEGNLPRTYFGKTWDATLPPSVYNRVWKSKLPDDAPLGMGNTFPHKITGGLTRPDTAFYKAFSATPWANDYVLQAAREAVVANAMGQDITPDLLAINLSSNDYVGHMFGPDSPEVLDITVQTDQQLSAFFRFLDGFVPGGLNNVTIALTADHGVAPLPETMSAAGFDAGRILETNLEKAADAALDARFGQQDWVLKFVKPCLYLDDRVLEATKTDPETARRVAAQAISAIKGVYAAYSSDQILEGRLPNTEMSGHIYRGFYPKVSGDILVVTEPLWITEQPAFEHAATHGSPYAYDSEVPLLLAGFGIQPGVHRDSVSPADLAPTLCVLLGIVSPWDPLESTCRHASLSIL